MRFLISRRHEQDLLFIAVGSDDQSGVFGDTLRVDGFDLESRGEVDADDSGGDGTGDRPADVVVCGLIAGARSSSSGRVFDGLPDSEDRFSGASPGIRRLQPER